MRVQKKKYRDQVRYKNIAPESVIILKNILKGQQDHLRKMLKLLTEKDQYERAAN